MPLLSSFLFVYKEQGMHYATFSMPENPITFFDRTAQYSAERLMNQIEPWFQDYAEYAQKGIVLGTEISALPSNVYKSIFVTHDGSYLFEVAYAMERNEAHCIYVKMIGSTTTVAASLETILYYSDGRSRVAPLSSLVGELNWMRKMNVVPHDLQSIVPVVSGREALDREIVNLVDHESDLFVYKSTQKKWEPLLYYEPGILEALMRGKFIRPPHTDVRGVYPFLTVNDSGRLRLNINHRISSFAGPIHDDQCLFDDALLSVMKLQPTDFSFMISFTDALDGVVSTGVFTQFLDPYETVLRREKDYHEQFVRALGGISHELLWIYGQVYDTNVGQPRKRKDASTITITKTIYDEVLIEFDDKQEQCRLGIYGNLVSMALTTQGVGYIPRRP